MSQTPQSVAELFSQYLRRQMTAQAEGLGYADPDGQVIPHEAAPVQPVDPRLAWESALDVVKHCPSGRTEPRWDVPPDWPALVAGQEPAVALAFCVGNFPQMVRNLHPLLQGGDLASLRQTFDRPAVAPPPLLEWAQQVREYPQVLLTVSMLRLMRRYEQANEVLKTAGKAPSAWQALKANEEAALMWHRGQCDEARAAWKKQKASVPVLFNRGMAALFLGDSDEAVSDLQAAVAQLRDTNAWHHLGQLYLALGNARR